MINEVRVNGRASGTAIQTRPEIDVVDFEDSEYADTLTVTAQDTYEEVYGIIERRLGKEYKSWFTLELAENADGYDFYELSTVNGKVHVKGNDGVSLATGINHYLKYYCNVNISQVGDQVNMPSQIPAIEGKVYKETAREEAKRKEIRARTANIEKRTEKTQTQIDKLNKEKILYKRRRNS